MDSLVVTCPVLDPDHRIPLQHAFRRVRGGANVSVPLTWTRPPGGARSLVVTIIDVHPVANFWVHWCIAGISPDITGIAEGASLNPRVLPPGAIETVNSYGEPGYGGPAPPGGTGPHDYVMSVYALRGLPPFRRAQFSRKQIEQLLDGLVVASGNCTGVFERA